jgi:hypothetical protein
MTSGRFCKDIERLVVRIDRRANILTLSAPPDDGGQSLDVSAIRPECPLRPEQSGLGSGVTHLEVWPMPFDRLAQQAWRMVSGGLLGGAQLGHARHAMMLSQMNSPPQNTTLTIS